LAADSDLNLKVRVQYRFAVPYPWKLSEH